MTSHEHTPEEPVTPSSSTPEEDGAAAPAGAGEQPPAGPTAGADGGEAANAAASEAAPEPEPDFKDLYMRAAAETENVRKRARRDVETAQARGVARLARELLPSLDNLERALEAAEAADGDAEHHLTKGIRLVQKELLAALTRIGIESYSPVGEQFDPHIHEAVAQTPGGEDAASGTVLQVYQPGYRYREEVLRPAKVVVAA